MIPSTFIYTSGDDERYCKEPPHSNDGGDRDTIISYSTNDTASNLPGPGRLLGNAYSYAGRRLERAVGAVVHKAGLGPNATYSKIQDLYGTEWRNDDKKSTLLYISSSA